MAASPQWTNEAQHRATNPGWHGQKNLQLFEIPWDKKENQLRSHPDRPRPCLFLFGRGSVGLSPWGTKAGQGIVRLTSVGWKAPSRPRVHPVQRATRCLETYDVRGATRRSQAEFGVRAEVPSRRNGSWGKGRKGILKMGHPFALLSPAGTASKFAKFLIPGFILEFFRLTFLWKSEFVGSQGILQETSSLIKIIR